jgi:hypothetical protein
MTLATSAATADAMRPDDLPDVGDVVVIAGITCAGSGSM